MDLYLDRVEVEIGHCSDHIHLSVNEYAYFCPRIKKVYIGTKINEKVVVRILNHESLHFVMMKIEGKHTSHDFDMMFKHGFTSVSTNGAPNEWVLQGMLKSHHKV